MAAAPTTTTSFSELVRRPGLKAGTYLGELVTPGIGRIMRAAGCELVFVDMEHSGFSYETVKMLLRGIHDAGLASIVRPPSKDYADLARACDVGAQALMPPMMNGADEARRAVACVRYPPEGIRGAAFGIAHDDYVPGAVRDKLEAANRRTSVVALIETPDGVENVDAIAAVDGVSCLFIGHFDLSLGMGIPGEFEHPDFIAARDRVVAAAKRHGKALGRLVPSPEEGAKLYGLGFDVILYSGDIWLLQAALSTGIERLRAACAEVRRG
jgi:2-keto-3-deoxy-L-rhamnonate aldolase RhmA